MATGKAGGLRVDTDPYSGATLAETVLANQRDLDQAYHAAAKAQVAVAGYIDAARQVTGLVNTRSTAKSGGAWPAYSRG
jgi:acyl-CoA reductase-like NAD-dependent aldehyde dehydrogenase